MLIVILFAIIICFLLMISKRQALRQDFAAGAAAKSHKRWTHFLNTIMDVGSNRGAKHEMGVHILNGGTGRTGSPLATALVKRRFFLLCG